MLKGKRILFAPLNWGLGHAGRSLPLILNAINLNATVLVCTSGGAAELISSEIPNVNLFDDGMNSPRYGHNAFHTRTRLFTIAFKKLTELRKELSICRSLIEDFKPDLIISDNRYGCYSPHIPSVLITHQLNSKHLPFASFSAALLNKMIKPFSHIWVPDFAPNESRISGNLSDLNDKRIQYIGPLSRFKKANDTGLQNSVLFLLSGPEPQRSIFENKIFDFVSRNNEFKSVLVRGTHLTSQKPLSSVFHQVYNLVSSDVLQTLAENNSCIVARSGYSSLMDIIAWDKPCVLIPTPGQYEQEYLARYHQSKAIPVLSQNEINNLLNEKIKQAKRLNRANSPLETQNLLKNILKH